MDKVSSTELAILHAAEAEFIEKGFSGARTVSIAQAAGVTHSMFHYYFRTKEQLFERVLNGKLSMMIDSIFGALEVSAHDSDALGGIESFVRCHYKILADNSSLPLFVLNEVVHHPERIELLNGMLSAKIKAVDLSYGKKYSEAIAADEIADVDLLTLISDILLLNLSSIVMRPLFHSLTNRSAEEYDAWRIEENLTIIRRRLAK